LQSDKKRFKIPTMKLEQLAEAAAGKEGRTINLGGSTVELSTNEIDCGISPQGSEWTIQKFKDTLTNGLSSMGPEESAVLASLLTGIRCVDYQDGSFHFTRIIGTVNPSTAQIS
jgi:hypothetical protein